MSPPPGALDLPVPHHAPPRGRPLRLEPVVRFEHRQVDGGDRPADTEILIAVPRSNERQPVRMVLPSPGCAGEIAGDYGNHILRYVGRAVPPGEVVAPGWLAEVANRFLAPFPGPVDQDPAPDAVVVLVLPAGAAQQPDLGPLEKVAGSVRHGDPDRPAAASARRHRCPTGTGRRTRSRLAPDLQSARACAPRQVAAGHARPPHARRFRPPPRLSFRGSQEEGTRDARTVQRAHRRGRGKPGSPPRTGTQAPRSGASRSSDRSPARAHPPRRRPVQGPRPRGRHARLGPAARVVRASQWSAWAQLREGTYILRSNVPDWSPEEFWKTYIQLHHAEAAFRIQWSGLTVRPIWHQRPGRVQAHTLVCFPACTTWKTLERWPERAGLGWSPRTVMEELARLPAADVVLPLANGRGMKLRCVVPPEKATAVLLDRLGLALPRRLRMPARPVRT